MIYPSLRLECDRFVVFLCSGMLRKERANVPSHFPLITSVVPLHFTACGKDRVIHPVIDPVHEVWVKILLLNSGSLRLKQLREDRRKLTFFEREPPVLMQ